MLNRYNSCGWRRLGLLCLSNLCYLRSGFLDDGGFNALISANYELIYEYISLNKICCCTVRQLVDYRIVN